MRSSGRTYLERGPTWNGVTEICPLMVENLLFGSFSEASVVQQIRIYSAGGILDPASIPGASGFVTHAQFRCDLSEG